MENNLGNETVEETEQINREKLIKIWIGEKADEMYPKMQEKYSFNWCAFFFGFLYLAYRRMYLVAFLDFLLGIVIRKIGMRFVGILIMSIVLGFAFYPLYKWDIERKLNKGRDMYKSNQEIIEYAKKKVEYQIMLDKKVAHQI